MGLSSCWNKTCPTTWQKMKRHKRDCGTRLDLQKGNVLSGYERHWANRDQTIDLTQLSYCVMLSSDDENPILDAVKVLRLHWKFGTCTRGSVYLSKMKRRLWAQRKSYWHVGDNNHYSLIYQNCRLYCGWCVPHNKSVLKQDFWDLGPAWAACVLQVETDDGEDNITRVNETPVSSNMPPTKPFPLQWADEQEKRKLQCS